MTELELIYELIDLYITDIHIDEDYSECKIYVDVTYQNGEQRHIEIDNS